MKNKLKQEGSQVYEKIVRLKFIANDGKYYATDAADTEVYLKPENPAYKNIPFYDDLFLDGKVIANLNTLKRLCRPKI